MKMINLENSSAERKLIFYEFLKDVFNSFLD